MTSFYKNQQGNITLSFLFFIGILVGALNYSLYVGRKVDDKLRLQNATDLSALAMANHTGHSLNMVAANNLAIGASLHISAAAQFVGRYRAILNTLAYDPNDTNNITDKNLFVINNQSAFDDSARVSALYTKAAKNLSNMNKNLVNNWIKGSVHKSFEQLQLSIPGSLALPSQMNRPVGNIDFSFSRLMQLNAQDTMCQTIKASQNMPDRNNFLRWLKTPLSTLELNSNGLDVLANLENSTVGMFNDFRASIAPMLQTLQAQYNQDCKGNLNAGNISEQQKRWCESYAYWSDNTKSLPIPAFEGCGLNNDGDLSNQLTFFGNNATDVVDNGNGQIQIRFCHVTLNGNQTNTIMTGTPAFVEGHLQTHAGDYLGNCRPGGGHPREFEIGFIIPIIESPDDFVAYQNSLRFGMMAGLPSLSRSEITRDCPNGWRDNQTSRCHYFVGGDDVFMDVRNRNDIWDRILWSYAEAGAVYSPSAADPASGIPADNNDFAALKSQLFWPAWSARLLPEENKFQSINYLKETSL